MDSDADTLIDAVGVALLLGVSRRHVYLLQRTHRDFPAPVTGNRYNRLWSQAEIEDWARRHGRLE